MAMPKRTAKSYDPATDHDPLPLLIARSNFDNLTKPERTRSVPSVTRGKCPDCANDKPTGIIRQGDHLAWRYHTRRMLSGAVLECIASGAHLCDAPAKPQAGVETPTCVCGEV